MTKMTRLKITPMSIRIVPRYSDVAKTNILSLQNLVLNITKQPNMRMNSFARVSKKKLRQLFKAIFIVTNYIFSTIMSLIVQLLPFLITKKLNKFDLKQLFVPE